MAWLGLGALASGIGRYLIFIFINHQINHNFKYFSIIIIITPLTWTRGSFSFFHLRFVLVLQRLLGGDATPAKVVEIKTDSLGNLPILHRDGAMVLYGPPPGSSDKKYEIVLNRPVSDNLNTCFR